MKSGDNNLDAHRRFKLPPMSPVAQKGTTRGRDKANFTNSDSIILQQNGYCRGSNEDGKHQ